MADAPATGLSAAQRELLLRRLANRSSSSSSFPEASVLVPVNPAGEAPPFFCVHAFGGGVNTLHRLAGAMGTGRPFYGLQSRGIAGDAPPLESIPAMAEAYAAAVRRVQPRGPYRLGGWCAGGVIAMEMARRLDAEGEPVALLALIGTVEPAAQPLPERDDAALLADMVRDNLALRLDGTALAHTALDELRQLPADGLVAYALERLRAHGLVPAGYSLDAFRGYFQVYRANHRAFRAFVQPHYDGEVTLFLPALEPDDPAIGPDYGWRGVVPRLRVAAVECTHGELLRDQHVARVAAALNAELARADAEANGAR